VDDLLVRLLLVGVVATSAFGWAWVARRGRAVRRRPASFEGVDAGVVLFTSTTCASCEEARRAVRSVLGDRGFREITYEAEPEAFATNRIRRVPTLASVEPGGDGWKAEGIPSARMLRRWLGGP
jgi:hypothetical protein